MSAGGWSPERVRSEPPEPAGARIGDAIRSLRWLRIGRIVLGYIVSAIVGVSVLPGAALVGTMILQFAGYEQDPMFSAFYLLGMIFGIAYFIGIALSFVPMMVWIVLSEVLHLRAYAWHALAGGIVGGIAWLTVSTFGEDPAFDRVTLDTALAGIIAGSVYWSIAGRSAGDWWKPAAPAATNMLSPQG